MFSTLRSRMSRTRCKLHHKLRNGQNIPLWSPNFWVSCFTQYFCSSFSSHMTSQAAIIFFSSFCNWQLCQHSSHISGCLFHRQPNTPPISFLYGLLFSHSAYNSKLWNYSFCKHVKYTNMKTMLQKSENIIQWSTSLNFLVSPDVTVTAFPSVPSSFWTSPCTFGW